MKKIFLDRKEWWRLVPDQTLFSSGGNTSGQVLNLAARHEEGEWIMVYLGAKAAFSIDLNKIARGRITAFWLDPRNAGRQPIETLATGGAQAFQTPAGWEDALLILEAARN